MSWKSSLGINVVFLAAFSVAALVAGATPSNPPDSLGTVSATLYTCPTNHALPSGTCYQLDVSCPLVQDYTVDVKIIAPPPPAVEIGMVMFLTGGLSDLFVEKASQGPTIINGLLAQNIGTVEVAFPGSGWQSNTNGAGVRAASCRFATVAQWAYTNVLPSGAALCACGNSAGSQQIGEGLSHFALGEYLTVGLMTSGPPFERVDWACMNNQKGQAEYCSGQKIGYGVSPGASIPFIDPAYLPTQAACSSAFSSHKSPLAAQFLNDSITSPDGELSYPTTQTIFLFGGKDTSSAINQGLSYTNLISPTPAPIVACAADSPHDVFNDPGAATMIVSFLTQYCYLPPSGASSTGKPGGKRQP